MGRSASLLAAVVLLAGFLGLLHGGSEFALVQNVARQAGITGWLTSQLPGRPTLTAGYASELAALVSGNRLSQDFVRSRGGIPALLGILQNDGATPTARAAAAKALGNAVEGNGESKHVLREHGEPVLSISCHRTSALRMPAVGDSPSAPADGEAALMKLLAGGPEAAESCSAAFALAQLMAGSGGNATAARQTVSRLGAAPLLR